MSLFQSTTSINDTVSLTPVDEAAAHEIGHALAGMDPWAHYDYPAQNLIDFLTWDDPSTRQLSILYDGEIAGVIALRNPWLQGPYIQLLGLMPDYQKQGVGSLVMNWVHNETMGSARNIWVVASEINTRAIAFYEKHGYKRVADLDDLVREGMNEILFRKRL